MMSGRKTGPLAGAGFENIAITTRERGTPPAAAQALKLAARGIPSFPCRADKRPACLHGFRDATAEPEAVCELWRRYPGELVGIPTGAASRLDVLDLDLTRHAEAAEWWAEHRERLPATRIHHTRSGGLHVWFRHRDGMRCWTARPVPGVDGRADGGYVVAWALLGGEVVSDAEPTPWPQWLLDLVLPPSPPPLPPRRPIAITGDRARRYALGALRNACERVASAGEGRRNVKLYGQVKDMCAFPELSAREIADALAIVATSVGLSERETALTIASALRAGGAR